MRWLIPLLLALACLAAKPAAPAIELAAAKQLLPTSAACDDVPCLIENAYRADSKARTLALTLFRATGDVAGVGPEEVMDGGFRGTIQLVPQLPINRYRKHLLWVNDGMMSIDRFFDGLFTEPATPNYRWQALEFRFVRSLVKHRPSAYAFGWTIEYNVEGSLNISEKGVRETLFHELFHLNDEAHGDWSARHLGQDYQAILDKCGVQPTLRCLAPYAPNDTRVRGGTYYAFQQNNGNTVHEYAAELAVRYFKEQSELLATGKLSRAPFKCGPAQNARAWNALVSEFFAGRDLTPACSGLRAQSFARPAVTDAEFREITAGEPDAIGADNTENETAADIDPARQSEPQDRADTDGARIVAFGHVEQFDCRTEAVLLTRAEAESVREARAPDQRWLDDEVQGLFESAVALGHASHIRATPAQQQTPWAQPEIDIQLGFPGERTRRVARSTLELEPRIAGLSRQVSVLKRGKIAWTEAKIEVRDFDAQARVCAQAVLRRDRVEVHTDPLRERTTVAERQTWPKVDEADIHGGGQELARWQGAPGACHARIHQRVFGRGQQAERRIRIGKALAHRLGCANRAG
jgi:hypothetical protein